MLRTALKTLLGLVLVLQGTVGAFAHRATGADAHAHAHCPHATEHGKPMKMPCCPDCCVPDDMAGCAACPSVAIAPILSILPQIASAVVEIQALAAVVQSRPTAPPTRPPIV
jgi:hypothetical protein